jgi:hypothetical protein
MCARPRVQIEIQTNNQTTFISLIAALKQTNQSTIVHFVSPETSLGSAENPGKSADFGESLWTTSGDILWIKKVIER